MKNFYMNRYAKFKCGEEVYYNNNRYVVNTSKINSYLDNLKSKTSEIIDETVYTLIGTPNTILESNLKSIKEYRDGLALRVQLLDEELKENK